MPLHQYLEPSLDIGPLGAGFKAENIEGVTLRIENLAALGRRPFMTGTAGAHLAEQRERVVGRPPAGASVAGTAPAISAAAADAADRAHFPGRTMAGHVVLLILRDRVVAHAGEEIVGIVVFADVLEAEPPIFAGAKPPLRRAVGRRRVTARPLAGRKLGAQPAVLVGFDPNPIKQRRVGAHDSDYAGATMAPSRLDRP